MEEENRRTMTIFGWMFLTIFWGGLFILTIFCMKKILLKEK